MSMLENFKPFNFNEGVPYVSITNNGITFNKSVVIKLDYPEFVVLLIDENSKRNVISVRWNGRDLLNTIQSMMGWELGKSGFRIDGVLLKEEHAMLFDLTTASTLS